MNVEDFVKRVVPAIIITTVKLDDTICKTKTDLIR